MIKRLSILIFIFISLTQLFAAEGGYMSKYTYMKGDTLKFHISSTFSTYTLTIYRYADPPILIQTINNIPCTEAPLPDSAYYYGCNWPVTYQMKVPDTWVPGAYYATYTSSIGKPRVNFYIREAVPGSYSKILVIQSSNTWQAYNPYGGKSLYDYNSSGGRSYKVSFLRPDESYYSGPIAFRKDELHLILWLYRNNIPVEFASNYDVYNEPNLLQNYNLVVISGHNEYWSYPERVQCEKYIRNGGNMMIISGNTCWWQVRYENNGNTLVCYKDRTKDPLNGVIDSLVTVNYYDQPVNNNENPFIGVSFRAAGYVNNNGNLTKAQGYGGYLVYNSHHWIYEGTNFKDGDIMGWDESIVGNEVDGALFNYVNGIPKFTGTDRSPQNFMVMGASPAYSVEVPAYTTNNHGFMGLFHYPGGGTVFNASTINWNLGLSYYNIGTSSSAFYGSDTNYRVQRLTKNVFTRLLTNNIPPDIVTWTPFTLVTDTIMNEVLQINKRDLTLTAPQSITFTITAVDPFSGTLNYMWQMNGVNQNVNAASFTKNFTSSDLQNPLNVMTVTVWNSKDSTSLSWNINSNASPRQLYFTSTPKTSVNANSAYLDTLKVYNYWNDPLAFSISGASWLSVNSQGILTGTAPSTGSFNVTARVSNQHNQSDSLTWTINVIGPTLPDSTNIISFTGQSFVTYVMLYWTTSYEYHNQGFDIEKFVKNKWSKIGNVASLGNSTTNTNYSFRDNSIKKTDRSASYRLKQINLDGTFKYSNTITVTIRGAQLSLQNYPNPFNPATIIEYALPEESDVKIIVYNTLGEIVFRSEPGVIAAGFHELSFNGSDLASGIYFLTMEAKPLSGSDVLKEIKKMLLLK